MTVQPSFFDIITNILSVIGAVTTVIGMIVWTHFLLDEFILEEVAPEFGPGMRWFAATCIVLSTAGAGLSVLVQAYGVLIPLFEIMLAVIGGGSIALPSMSLLISILGNL